MKKFMLFILISIAISAFCSEQLSYSFKLEDSVISNSISSYFQKNLNDYYLFNTTFVRHGNDEFSDQTYLSHYLRNRLWINKSFKNLDLTSFVYLGYYPEGNKASHLDYSNDAHILESNLSYGLEVKYQINHYQILLKTKNLNNYFNDVTESDLMSEMIFSTTNLSYNPYFKFEHFNDLNELDDNNYNIVGVGVSHFRKLNHSSYLNLSAEIGNSTVYDDIPYYGEVTARYTHKITRDWFILNRVNLEAYYAQDFAEAYQGESFIESMFQYNFGYNNNLKNFYRLGALANLDGYLLLNASMKYYLNTFEFNAEYSYNIANESDIDSIISGEISFPFLGRYSIAISDQIMIGEETTNSLTISTNIRI